MKRWSNGSHIHAEETCFCTLGISSSERERNRFSHGELLEVNYAAIKGVMEKRSA
jgi:hypothetical protein